MSLVIPLGGVTLVVALLSLFFAGYITGRKA